MIAYLLLYKLMGANSIVKSISSRIAAIALKLINFQLQRLSGNSTDFFTLYNIMPMKFNAAGNENLTAIKHRQPIRNRTF